MIGERNEPLVSRPARATHGADLHTVCGGFHRNQYMFICLERQEPISMTAQVIVLPNHKGGVTKTSSSATFLVLLHLLGTRVLGIDTDPQSNMSSLFGYKTPIRENTTAYDAIMGQIPLQATIRRTYIHPDGNAFYVP